MQEVNTWKNICGAVPLARNAITVNEGMEVQGTGGIETHLSVQVSQMELSRIHCWTTKKTDSMEVERALASPLEVAIDLGWKGGKRTEDEVGALEAAEKH